MSKREQLEELGRNNALVHSHLVANQHHRFPTYEAMLESLVLALAEQTDVMMAEALRQANRSPLVLDVAQEGSSFAGFKVTKSDMLPPDAIFVGCEVFRALQGVKP